MMDDYLFVYEQVTYPEMIFQRMDEVLQAGGYEESAEAGAWTGQLSKRGWRVAFILNNVLTNKEIARQGYISLTSYYAQVCEN